MDIGELTNADLDPLSFRMQDGAVGRGVDENGIATKRRDEGFDQSFGGDLGISGNLSEPVDSPYTTVVGKFQDGNQRISSGAAKSNKIIL